MNDPSQDSRHANEAPAGRLLDTLLEDAPLLFHIKDDQGRYVAASRSWAKLLGIERDMLIGRTDAELLPTSSAALLRGREHGIPLSPQFRDSEEEVPTADGIRHLHARRFLGKPRPGDRPYLFMIAADVTPQVQMRDALKAAVVAKARLFASACHDMRQPLQAAGLFLEVLKRRVGSDDRAREASAAATRALQAIERIASEMLTLSQLEATAEHPSPGPVKLADLMAELSAEFAPQAEAKGLQLRAVPSSLTVASDPHLLARILRNLLSNAVAYTETGKILFGCRRRPGGVEIQVLDTGPGISASDQEAIFTEYRRLDGSSAGDPGGFGLGLTIVARLAAVLGHRIGLRSVPGFGSVFSVTVPLLAPPRSQERALPIAEQGQRKVLLVGDDARVRRPVRAILARSGLEAVEAADLQELAGVLGRMRGPPLLVLAERTLPNGRFGTEAVAHVRARFGRDVPAVLVADRIGASLRTAARTARCRSAQLPLSAPLLSRLIAAGPPD